MNSILCWHLIKNKANPFFKTICPAVLDLWEKNYNLKVLPKPTICIPVSNTEKQSTFNNFLLVDKQFAYFEAIHSID